MLVGLNCFWLMYHEFFVGSISVINMFKNTVRKMFYVFTLFLCIVAKWCKRRKLVCIVDKAHSVGVVLLLTKQQRYKSIQGVQGANLRGTQYIRGYTE